MNTSVKASMSKKIFINSVVISVVSLVAAFVLTLGVIYTYFSDEYATALRNETEFLAEAVNAGGTEFLKSVNSPHRITIINPDGSVAFDNKADPLTLDNHLNRTEVAEAFKSGFGESVRNSETLSEKTVNEACLLESGQVLRISVTYTSELSMFKSILPPIALIAALSIILSFLLARRMASSITRPINEIDFDNPKDAYMYDELTPLVDKIAAQNDQIERQFKELQSEHEKQDTMRREFTANVSHELKTPLTSISGYAELIENGIAKPEDIGRFAGKIHDESQRLITLVGDIIKLSQLDENESPTEKEEIDLYEVTKEVLGHLEKAMADSGITAEICGEHLKIFGITQIVEEIVFNLCDNAVKYNKQGGHIKISLVQCVDGVELSVSDTGIGISDSDIDHIFERFYRADKSHSKEIGGTGLGLSIVKHGALAIDASLSVESEIGKGTTVKVLF